MTVLNIRLTVDTEKVESETHGAAVDASQREDDRRVTWIRFELPDAESWYAHMNA